MSDVGMSPYVNPFNAGFGVSPPYVAGRDPIVHRLLANLRDGPGRSTYVNLVVGDRGVGKTVLLMQLQEHIETEFQWTPFRWTAGPDRSFADDLDDNYDRLADRLTHRPTGRARTGSVSVNAGVVKAQLDVSSKRRPRTVNGQLTSLGHIAQDHHTALVLLVDELQAGRSDDLSTMLTTIQETNGQKIPIALVAAGLPNTPARLRNVPGATFVERQRAVVLGNLDVDEVREALERPLVEADRDYEPGIFDPMVTAAGGYPYAVQLVGKHTWDAAGDNATISIAHARIGVTRATADLDEIYSERWAKLSDRQKDYMVAVVANLNTDGVAASSAVANTLGGSTSDFSKIRDALLNRHQLLYSDTTNAMHLTLPGLDQWIARRTGESRSPSTGRGV